jgi:hypothetical protein
MVSGLLVLKCLIEAFLGKMIRADGDVETESYVRSDGGRRESIGEVAYQNPRWDQSEREREREREEEKERDVVGEE